MSVLAVVFDEPNLEEMEGWSHWIADSLEQDIKIFYVGSKPIKESGSKINYLNIENAFPVIFKELESTSVKLLLMDHPLAKRGAKAKLLYKILSLGFCDSITLRFPHQGGCGGNKILVPTAGGENSIEALKLSKHLTNQSNESSIDVLFVESDVSDLSKEVGMKRLEGLLGKSGFDVQSEPFNLCVSLGNDVSAIIHAEASSENYDLILLGASDSGLLNRAFFGTLPDRLLKEDGKVAVGVFEAASKRREKIKKGLKQWLLKFIPQLERDSRVRIYESIEVNSKWSFDFVALICFSTALAALGLMLNSAPVIIGAMLVAPLMTPILGASLSLIQGNRVLMVDCSKSLLFGYFCALILGVLLGIFGKLYGVTDQMQSRSEPDVPDLLIALISGMAAAYCYSRPRLVSALAGVAIAAALVPPIATAGIAIALAEQEIAIGATLLFTTNVVFIVIGASVTFFTLGIRAKSKRDGMNIWVTRFLLALVIIAAIHIVPLGSALLGKMSSKLSLHENRIDKLEKNIHQEVVKFTGMDLYVGLEELEGNKGEKILLIDVIKSDFEVLKLGEFISEIVEDFYKEAVVVRLRECIEFPLSDKNNHSP
ncbi:DUF389 domain-containing protein [Verrucomicrobiales bacterium]|nr:DUF389 domain-containing protein [Verrucomicrobiales bacterium]